MTRLFNKAGWIIAGALGLLVVASITGVVFGGPLDPPSGPGPTQRNLIFQPANCAAFPITISMPGSYLLAQNIAMPAACAKDGIDITAAGDVTLDLGGFELIGVAGSHQGISTTATPAQNVEIRNGEVLGWGFVGIFSCVGSVNDRLDDLRVHDNSDGVEVGSTSTLTNSTIAHNTYSGITVCGNGNKIDGNIVADNGEDGIDVEKASNVISNNTLYHNMTSGFNTAAIEVFGTTGNGNRIDGNNIDGNAHTAIQVDGSFNLITRNAATNYGGTSFSYPGANNTFGPTESLSTPIGNPWANIVH